MASHIAILLSMVLFFWSSSAYSNRVIELSDKFLDIYNSTAKSWLVKFYGQSCHRSKKLGKLILMIHFKFSFSNF